ncbi:MAG TPA: fatty acid--CoA ligase family protein [Acidimicrobiales bacterium]
MSGVTETFQARIDRLTRRTDLCQDAILDDTSSWTWADIGTLRDRLEVEVAANCVHAECVGIVLRQDAATVGALLATLGSGICALLLSPLATDDELAAEISSLGGLPVVAQSDDWRRPGLLGAARSSGTVALTVSDQSIEVLNGGSGVKPGYEPDAGAAVIVRTSGTTGVPQRVAVTWQQLDAVGERVTPAEPGGASGITINVIPMYTIGAIIGLAGSVWRGRPTAILQRFEPRRWAELVRDHRPRQVGIPPAGFQAILQADIPAEWLSSVSAAVTGSSAMDIESVREFVRRYDIAIMNQYGSTEFGGPVTGFELADWPQFGQTKLGSVGRPRGGAEIRVVDPETGEPAPTYGMLQVNQGSGWVQTTDLAEIDDDGFIWIRGRADDVIVRGGFKIPPDEVERVLVQHPDVMEAVVVGLPDARLGQVPVAAVTLRPGVELVESDLIEFARKHLTIYMVPVTVRAVEVIPRNEMLKPLRREVVAMFSEVVVK